MSFFSKHTLSLSLNLLTFGIITFALIGSAQESASISVPRDYTTITEAVQAAPDHAEVVIEEGTYDESISIVRPVLLRAEADADVVIISSDQQPAIQIRNTQDVTISGLNIVGGKFGIDVFLSENVLIQSNTISGSKSAGMRVRMSVVSIRENNVSDTQEPYGRGVYLANTMAWGESEIIDNVIHNHPLSGIQTNMVGMVHIEGNVVRDNGYRGINITEMTHADVIGNIVENNNGTGIHIMDMSMALVCNNIVSDTKLAGESASIRYGNGVTIDYHSEAVLFDNAIQDSPQHAISVLYGSSVHLDEVTLDNDMSGFLFVDDSQVHEAQGCVSDFFM